MNRNLRNVLLLGVAFMLFLSASQTMSNIQKTLTSSIEKDDPYFQGDGYYSQAIFFASFSIFNWAAPSMIILIGPKFSMCLGIIFYIVFISQFLIPHTWSVYLCTFLMGFGGALLWTAQGNYLTLNSTKETITRNCGIFFTFANSNMIIGNLFIMFAFKGKDDIDAITRTYVLLTLISVGSVGFIALCLLPRATTDKLEEGTSESPLEAFLGAIKLFFTSKMLLLCVSFIYIGMQMGFYGGIYSSCVGFTKKFDNRKELVGISGVFLGVGEVFGGIVFTVLGNKLGKCGRSIPISLGCLVHVLAFCLILLNLPNDSPFSDTDEEAILESNAVLAMFCSFLLGLGDFIFNSISTALLGTIYADNSAPAFAILQCCFTLGSVIICVVAPVIGLYYQLALLFAMALIGTISFIRVEYICQNDKTSNISEKSVTAENGQVK